MVLTRRDALRSAAVLAFGVVAFSHMRHLGATQPVHTLLDATLALPLALVAVCAGARLRTRPMQAVATAVLFGAMLVPAGETHGWIHAAAARNAGVHDHLIPAAEAGFGHHLRDALAALPVALALAGFGGRRRGVASRRRWALAAAVAVVGATLPVTPALAALPAPFSVAMTVPPELTGDNITLTAAENAVQVMPAGAPTTMWTYNGIFPGPTIRRPSGTTTHVTVVNSMPTDPVRFPAPTELTLHHHGNHSAAIHDGHPHDPSALIPLGGSRTYEYEFMEGGAPERPAFQWYHDHRMDFTARNVWMGLAGMVILDPAQNDVLGQQLDAQLPKGAYDVPIMIADRKFDAGNQIGYTFDPNGVPGNIILANGAPQPYFNVEARTYRIRLLNASNSQPFLLSLAGSLPMTQIGTESGLLPAPVTRTQIHLAPAERAEVVLDFTGRTGQRIALRNELGFGPNFASVMRFDVGAATADTSAVPPVLRPAPDYGDAVTPPSTTRLWLLTQTGADQPLWTINAQSYDPARADARPRLGTVERWVFVNTTSVDHVMHIHDVDWRVLLRTSGVPPDPAIELHEAPLPAEFAIDPVEAGLKESFVVHPFEVVEVAARFTDHLGLYVFHCHVLEHEDHSMMAQFEVV